MSATALATLRSSGAPDVLVDYAGFVAGLKIGPTPNANAATPPGCWSTPTPTWRRGWPGPPRHAWQNLARTRAWSFITWCFLEGVVTPDLDLLLAKTPGDLYAEWGQRHHDEVARVVEVAQRFSWSANWTRDVARSALALVCLWSGKPLDELTDDVFDAFTAALASTPSAGHDARLHNQARAFSLHQACYELRICSRTPRKNRPAAATVAEALRAVPQPDIRRWRHTTWRWSPPHCNPRPSCSEPTALSCSASTWPPTIPTCAGSASSNAPISKTSWYGTTGARGGAGWPGTSRWRPRCPNAQSWTCGPFSRTWQCGGGLNARPANWSSRVTSPASTGPCPELLPPTSTGTSWPRSPGSPIPSLATPWPSCAAPGCGSANCWTSSSTACGTSAGSGTWVKVPLGKLGTERTVPLDEPTLADFDAWMARRGPQRALAHPRHGQPADFLFVERGRRLSAFRLRHGLDQAVAVAGLTGPGGQPLRVTPHQLRHTYVIYGPSLGIRHVRAA